MAYSERYRESGQDGAAGFNFVGQRENNRLLDPVFSIQISGYT